MSNDEEMVENFKKTLESTKQIASRLIENGRNLTEVGQSALDLVEAVEPIFEVLPEESNNFTTHISNGFNEFNFLAKQINESTEVDSLMNVMHTTATSTSVTFASSEFIRTEHFEKLASLNNLLHRNADIDQTKEFMLSLDLNIPHGSHRSSLDLLISAKSALERPFASEGYATAVLVPLRESIQTTIEELLKKRPVTEKAKSWVNKVKSILNHCGKDSVSPETIDRVADTTHTLINALSTAKDREMNRESITTLFDEGVSLLQDMFNLIDKEKLSAV